MFSRFQEVEPLPNVVSVVFREGGRSISFDAGSIELAIGDLVVVDSVRGNDFGRVVGVASGLSGDRSHVISSALSGRDGG